MHETIAEIRKNRTNFPLVLRFRSTGKERIVEDGGREKENFFKNILLKILKILKIFSYIFTDSFNGEIGKLIRETFCHVFIHVRKF